MIGRARSSIHGPVLLVLAVLFGGCASSAEPPEPSPDFRFDSEPRIRLDVARIDVGGADLATRSPSGGKLGDAFAFEAGPALRRWAEDRLEAAGRSGKARFEVVNAGVEAEKLSRAEGAAGLFGHSPGTRYTMTVEGRVTIIAPDGRSGMASARVVRKKSIEGNRTRDERQQFRTELTETTMAEFDRQMERAIRQHLNPWVL